MADRNALNLDARLAVLEPTAHLLIVDHAALTRIVPTERLATFQHVRYLSASLCGLESLENLPRAEHLRTIWVEDNELGGVSLEPLTACINLKELYLAGNHFNAVAEFVPLAELPSLKVLDISYNPVVTHPGVREAMELLLPHLEQLIMESDLPMEVDSDSDMSSSSESSFTEEPTKDSDQLAAEMKDLAENDSDYEPDYSDISEAE